MKRVTQAGQNLYYVDGVNGEYDVEELRELSEELTAVIARADQQRRTEIQAQRLRYLEEIGAAVVASCDMQRRTEIQAQRLRYLEEVNSRQGGLNR